MHEPPTAARILRIVIFTAILLVVSALLVMLLWNWLVPSIFELRRISLPEALGLLLLSRLLLGGVRGRQFYGGWRRRQRWKNMTEEERDQWRQKKGHSTRSENE